MPNSQIHFIGRNLAQNWPDLAELTVDDIPLHAPRFRGGINNWVVQSYLQLKEPLRAQGVETSISEAARPGIVNVTHRDCLNRMLGPYRHCYTVGVRADRAPLEMSDWEILQNNVHQRTARQHYLPFWPQPGLIPRDSARGDTVKTIAYFGRTGASSTWLESAAFHAALADMGVHFEIREDRWFDYSDVDLVLAHRAESQTMLNQKPASKLINAWLAGVPALLGNEPAYAALRRTRHDFVAIDSAEDVLCAVKEFKRDPALYRAMIAQAINRRDAYSAERIRALWVNFLMHDVMPKAQRALAAGPIPWPTYLKRVASQKIQSRMFKAKHAVENARLGARRRQDGVRDQRGRRKRDRSERTAASGPEPD